VIVDVNTDITLEAHTKMTTDSAIAKSILMIVELPDESFLYEKLLSKQLIAVPLYFLNQYLRIILVCQCWLSMANLALVINVMPD
jgi:hypothetical protein